MKNLKSFRYPLHIILAYVVTGSLWILFSDLLVARYVPPSYQNRISIAKGWLFITVTALLLALLLHRYHRAQLLQQRRTREIIDNLPSLLYVFDREGRLVLQNRAMAQVCGTRAESGVGMTREELGFTATSAAQHRANDLQVLRSGENLLVEEENLQMDGVHTYMTAKFPLTGSDGVVEAVCGISADITERKNLEKALLESEEQFRTLCTSAPIGIFRTDAEGNNIFGNPRWLQITGLSSVEARGTGWLRCIHPEDRERVFAQWKEVMGKGEIFCEEHRLLVQGKTVWIRALASPVVRGDGSAAGYVGTVEDITALQQVRQEAVKNQKLESLGLLAGGIAHDFNNILTTILGNISMARMKPDDPDKLHRWLLSAETGAARARDLTRQLLTFAKGGEPIRRVAHIRPLLREAAEFALHGSGVRCDMRIADELWPVEVDEGQMVQVFHNLVLNAVQAMPDGGTVTVTAENLLSSRGERAVRICVADTGVGIPDKHLQRVFDPYFTTKPQGSGLGLATCYSVVKKHGGDITASSTPGSGSTFTVTLQAASAALRPEAPAAGEAPPAGGRVLVMDDEPDVLNVARLVLEEYGYSAACAADGAAALELYRKGMEEGAPFDAVILDLTVPGGMGGMDALAALREIDPQVRGVVSSGYCNDPVMASYREHGFRAVLCKPYRAEEMIAVLGDVAGKKSEYPGRDE